MGVFSYFTFVFLRAFISAARFSKRMSTNFSININTIVMKRDSGIFTTCFPLLCSMDIRHDGTSWTGSSPKNKKSVGVRSISIRVGGGGSMIAEVGGVAPKTIQ